jgi:hypothetical protein
MTYTATTPTIRCLGAQMLIPPIDTVQTLGTPASHSVGAGTANQAYYQPFVMPYTAFLTAMAFYNSTGTNNHDLGIYQGTTRLTSRGPTASVAATFHTWTLGTPLLLNEGVLYQAAFATAGTATLLRYLASAATNPRFRRAIQTGLSSATLGASATYAVPGSDSTVPILLLTFDR